MVPHPIIVDFAIALLVVSVGFDLLATIVDDRDLRVVSWWTLELGTVAAALAVLSGYVAAGLAGGGARIAETVTLHRNAGITALSCFAVCALWRARRPASFPERFRDLYWLLTVVGLGALLVAGYFGGVLVFGLGVGHLPRG